MFETYEVLLLASLIFKKLGLHDIGRVPLDEDENYAENNKNKNGQVNSAYMWITTWMFQDLLTWK